MVDFLDAAKPALRTGFCALTTIPAAVAPLYSRALDPFGTNPFQAAAAETLNRGVNARNAFCSEPPTDTDGLFDPPFQGGQCPGDNYNFTRVIILPPNPPTPPRTFTGVVGPLTYVEEVTDQRKITAIEDGNGERVTFASVDLDRDQPIIEVTNVVRSDGQPDVCGDPASRTAPYNQNSYTTNIPSTFVDNSTGNTVNLNPVGIFAPVFINAQAQFEVPFNLRFAPNINLSGTVNLSTGDTVFNNVSNTEFTAPNGPIELPEGQQPDDDQFVIVGVRIISSVQKPPFQGTELAQPGPSLPLWVPRLGNLSFRYQLPGGGIFQGENLSVKYTDQVFWADRVAVGALFVEENGVSSSVRLIVVPRNERCG